MLPGFDYSTKNVSDKQIATGLFLIAFEIPGRAQSFSKRPNIPKAPKHSQSFRKSSVRSNKLDVIKKFQSAQKILEVSDKFSKRQINSRNAQSFPKRLIIPEAPNHSLSA